jgi:hypothetical protein
MACRCGGLFAYFPGERLRLVGHQLHGSHHAAALCIDTIVLGADLSQESVQVERSARSPDLRQLLLEQGIQAIRGTRLADGALRKNRVPI